MRQRTKAAASAAAARAHTTAHNVAARVRDTGSTMEQTTRSSAPHVATTLRKGVQSVAIGGATVVGAAVVGSALAAKKATEVAVSFDQKHEVSKQMVQGTTDAGIQAMAFVVDRPNEVHACGSECQAESVQLLVLLGIISCCDEYFNLYTSFFSMSYSTYCSVSVSTSSVLRFVFALTCFNRALSLRFFFRPELPAVSKRMVPLRARRHQFVLRRERPAHAARRRARSLAQDQGLQPDMAPR